jgi:hypothetical protein
LNEFDRVIEDEHRDDYIGGLGGAPDKVTDGLYAWEIDSRYRATVKSFPKLRSELRSRIDIVAAALRDGRDVSSKGRVVPVLCGFHQPVITRTQSGCEQQFETDDLWWTQYLPLPANAIDDSTSKYLKGLQDKDKSQGEAVYAMLRWGFWITRADRMRCRLLNECLSDEEKFQYLALFMGDKPDCENPSTKWAEKTASAVGKLPALKLPGLTVPTSFALLANDNTCGSRPSYDELKKLEVPAPAGFWVSFGDSIAASTDRSERLRGLSYFIVERYRLTPDHSALIKDASYKFGPTGGGTPFQDLVTQLGQTFYYTVTPGWEERGIQIPFRRTENADAWYGCLYKQTHKDPRSMQFAMSCNSGPGKHDFDDFTAKFTIKRMELFSQGQ